MKWLWCLSRAGYVCGDTGWGVLRETTRALCIAECLRLLGERVEVRGVVPYVRGKESICDAFSQILGGSMVKPDVVVEMAEHIVANPKVESVPANIRVGFKTSKSYKTESRMLRTFDLLFAHEHDPAHAEHEKLIAAGWLVFHPMIEFFIQENLLENYLKNDLSLIRDRFFAEQTGKVGFMGTPSCGRGGHIQKLVRASDEPELFDIQATMGSGYPLLEVEDYLRWVSGLTAGIHIAGDSPKATRFAELAMMGVPIVNVPCEMLETPAVTRDNTILLEDWDDASALREGLTRKTEIVNAADTAYCEGWSPMGQAKQLLRRVKHGC